MTAVPEPSRQPRPLARLSCGSDCRTLWHTEGGHWRLVFPVSEMMQGLWGRFSTCGRFSIGLPTSVQEPPRRVENPPQVENLPHIRRLAGD